jgi:hypothetical protein
MPLSINGTPLLSARITEDRIGAWIAEVEADTEETIAGAVTLDVEGETFVGTVWQGEVDSSRWKGMIVGGGGGTQKILEGGYYVQPTVRTVLADLARDAGETVSPEIPPAILIKSLERWTRLQGFAHTAFRQLADELGVEWRITRLGGLWLGEETWLPIEADVIEGQYQPDQRALEVSYAKAEDDRPVLKPGGTYDGKKIQRVITIADGDGLRQILFFDDERGTSGLLNTMRRLIREVVWPKLQLARVHGARVCEQDADGNVTVAMDDRAIGGKSRGLSRIPLGVGLPGTKVRTTSSTRLRVWWDAGNPTKPRAGHFDQGTPAEEIEITVASKFAVNGDCALGDASATSPVALADKDDARWQALLTAIATAASTEAGAAGLSGMTALNSLLTAPPVSLVMAESIAATKVKAV